MKATPTIKIGECAGRWLGRVWLGVVAREKQAVHWLVGKGMPVVVARATLWIIELGLFCVLLYAAFWVAVLLLFAVAVAWVGHSLLYLDDGNKQEWREGHSGFGLYDKTEWRHDMGDDEP